MNKTYIPYGKMGREGQARQVAQDANALSASINAVVTRSVSKGNSTLYCNDAWDLVDAISTGRCKIDDLKDEDLPEELRKLDKAGRRARVEGATRQRGEIQKQILRLNQDRESFLTTERKKQAKAEKDTLDTVILDAVSEQASRARIQFNR